MKLHIWMTTAAFSLLVVGCASLGTSTEAGYCPVTEPAWVKPPEDAAVLNDPEYGHYFVNEDASIMASAGWTKDEEYRRVRRDGVKVGWFRPVGASLDVTAHRLDGDAPPFEAHIPCCYPTRFQSSGLFFPTEGCWEVIAKAADSVLSFIVRIDP